MCGLAGGSGKNLNLAALKLMGIDNEARGTHSAGIGGFIDESYTWYKLGMAFNKIAFDKEFDSIAGNSNQVIMHTRYATMGARDKDNAHPYFIGRATEGKSAKLQILGSHNGWLLEESRVQDPEVKAHDFKNFALKHGYTYKVDSQLIYKHISQTGDLTAFKDIEGSMALAFIHKNVLFLYRRESKPLYIYRPNKTNIYYSSREESFVKSFGVDVKKDVELLEPNKLFSFKNGVQIDEVDIPKPKIHISLDEIPSGFYPSANEDYYRRHPEKKPKASGRYLAGGHSNGFNNNYHRASSFPSANRGPSEDFSDELPFDSEPVRRLIPAGQPSDSAHERMKTLLINSSIDKSVLLNVFNTTYKNDKFTFEALGYKFSVVDPEYISFNKEVMSSNGKIKRVADDQAIIVMNLTDDKGNPLKDFKIIVENQKEIIQRTNKEGKVGIRLLPKTMEGGEADKVVKMFIHTPMSYTDEEGKYASIRVHEIMMSINRGQVVEVTCKLPFLKDSRKGGSDVRELLKTQHKGSEFLPETCDKTSDSEDNDCSYSFSSEIPRDISEEIDDKIIFIESPEDVSYYDMTKYYYLQELPIQLSSLQNDLLQFFDDELMNGSYSHDMLASCFVKAKNLGITQFRMNESWRYFIQGIHNVIVNGLRKLEEAGKPGNDSPNDIRYDCLEIIAQSIDYFNRDLADHYKLISAYVRENDILYSED